MNEIEQQRAAFEAYLKDCDIHGIVPDTAGAFNYAWQAAVELDRQQRGEPVGMTSIADMCRILKEHYVEEAERTDCTILYTVTFDQLRAIYDRGRREGPQPANPAIKESLTVAEPVPLTTMQRQMLRNVIHEVGQRSRCKGDYHDQVADLLSTIASATQPAEPDVKESLTVAEPVCEVQSVQPGDNGSYGVVRFLMGDPNNMWSFPLPGTKLFLSPQPAASAEPVAEVACTHTQGWTTRWIEKDGKRNIPPLGALLYAAPVAAQPSVPEIMHSDSDRIPAMFSESIEATVGFVDGWNACRAMLEAAPTQPADGQAQQDADMVTCACGDLYPATSYGAGFINAAGMCENCHAGDAAGKQEVDKADGPLIDEGTKSGRPDPAMAGDEVLAYGIVAANTGKLSSVVLARDADDIGEYRPEHVIPLVKRIHPANGEEDPLQGAANWLLKALSKCDIADIQYQLIIGHNRAKRLFDAAIQERQP